MSEASPAILAKIKLLLNLVSSPNPHEAENAKAMADKLIAKYNVTQGQLDAVDDKTPLYGENEKLFKTIGIVGWKQQLALAIATYFDCQIVQEELRRQEGDSEFSYFVYGDDDQVKDTQFVYHAFLKKINFLVEFKCIGRGPVYIDSYCEGVVEAIRWNIQMEGIEIPDVKRPVRKVEETKQTSDKLSTTKQEKPTPADRKVDVNAGSMIKDVMAYFRGVDDGKQLSLQDILEIEAENKESERLKENNENV